MKSIVIIETHQKPVQLYSHHDLDQDRFLGDSNSVWDIHLVNKALKRTTR